MLNKNSKILILFPGTVAIEDITADGDYEVVNFSVTSFEGKKISSASSLPKNVFGPLALFSNNTLAFE